LGTGLLECGGREVFPEASDSGASSKAPSSAGSDISIVNGFDRTRLDFAGNEAFGEGGGRTKVVGNNDSVWVLICGIDAPEVGMHSVS
jgi:hypothetical protein